MPKNLKTIQLLNNFIFKDPYDKNQYLLLFKKYNKITNGSTTSKDQLNRLFYVIEELNLNSDDIITENLLHEISNHVAKNFITNYCDEIFYIGIYKEIISPFLMNKVKYFNRFMNSLKTLS